MGEKKIVAIYKYLYILLLVLVNVVTSCKKKFTNFFVSKFASKKEKTFYHQRIKKKVPFDDVTPIWVLSTGRCGTALLTEVCATNPFIESNHEPSPNLFSFTHDYYQNIISESEAQNALKYLRDEFVHNAAYKGKTYLETNNRASYIVPLLYNRYPNSKFIFITRHPYDYIVSGVKRGWYRGHNCDFARICPKPEDDDMYSMWNDMSQYEQIAWNWKRVNEIIINDLKNIPEEKVLQFNSEQLFNGKEIFLKKICDFVEPRGGWNMHTVVRKTRKKVNPQLEGQYIEIGHLSKEEQKSIKDIVKDVATELDYFLR